MAFVIDNPGIRKSLRRGFQFEDEVCEQLRVALPDEYGIFPSALIEARQLREPFPSSGRRSHDNQGPQGRGWQQGWRGSKGAPGPQRPRLAGQPELGPKRPRELDFIVCGPTGLFVLEAKSWENVEGPFSGRWLLREQDQSRTLSQGTSFEGLANKLRENMLGAGNVVKYSRDPRLSPYGGRPRAAFVFPDGARIHLFDGDNRPKADFLDDTVSWRLKSQLPGLILSARPPLGAPASPKLTAKEAEAILRMFRPGLRVDPTISGDYKITERGEATIAPNGLPYVVCRLEHIRDHRVKRGKWYDMRAIGRKDRELFDAQIDRHGRVLLAAKGHPNVCVYHEFQTDHANEGYWVLEDFVDSEGLDERIARGGAPVARPVDFMRQVAAGLAAIHRGGYVARGFNPTSILVERGTERPFLTNFETAKAADGGPTVTAGGELADDRYRAPELRVAGAAQSETDVRADVYSWAAIFQDVVGGEAGVAALPAPVAALVDGCLSPLRTQRPESMEVVLRALEGVP